MSEPKMPSIWEPLLALVVLGMVLSFLLCKYGQ